MSRLRILLDTSFLIELRGNNKKAAKVFRDLLNKVDDIVAPAIVFYELYKGGFEVLRLLKTNKELLWIDSLKDWVTIPGITEEISKKAGSIYSILKGNGLEIDDGDVLFLAFCKKNDIILTADKHLENACKILSIDCVRI